jgi:hypothetical protein
MMEENGRISFRARPKKIGSWTVLRLPKDESVKLPSRGMVMVEGTINGFHFEAPLEPDGNKGHWLKVEKNLLSADPSGAITLDVGVSRVWPEPKLPEDLKRALDNSEKAYGIWEELTPAAHWDWLRWIRSTKNPETRKKRIEVACSKLTAGMRRPCCFNRNLCSEVAVSSNGVLLAEEK